MCDDTKIDWSPPLPDISNSAKSFQYKRRHSKKVRIRRASMSLRLHLGGEIYVQSRSGGRKSSGSHVQSPQNDADDGGVSRRAAYLSAYGAKVSAKIMLSRVQHRQSDSHQPGRASALAGWSAADCCRLIFSQNVLAPCRDVCYDDRSTLTIESAYTARGD